MNLENKNKEQLDKSLNEIKSTMETILDEENNVENVSNEPVHNEAAINESTDVNSDHPDIEEVEITSNINSSTSTENLGEYFTVSTYDELKELLDDYCERTSSRFITQHKSKGFGASEIDLTGHRIVWKDQQTAGRSVDSFALPYDGIPRISVGFYTLTCQYGEDASAKRKLKRKERIQKLIDEGKCHPNTRNLKIPTKKCGCPAKIYIKQVIKYPEYKISKQTERRKRDSSALLRDKLLTEREGVAAEMLILGRLPHICEHRFHDMVQYGSDKLREALHQDLIYLIKELYVQKYSNIEIMEALNCHVTDEMFHDQQPPDASRRKFYPSKQDIRNYITRVRNISRITHAQEDFIHNLIENVKVKDENVNIHFNVDVQGYNEEQSDDEFFEPDLDATPAKKKKKNPKPKKIAPIRTYLFCFQTPQQQRLLKRYGDVIFLVKCNIQKKKKTKSIAFDIFNVMVQTNVDYQTVGCILVSREQKDGLINGLTVLKDWNTYWRPKYFIVDCCDEIYKAVDSAFPDAQYFITPHSCEEKWLEFLNMPSNELKDYSEEVITFLRNMAYSYTEDSLSIAAALFEGSDIWQKSAKLRTWFQSTWLHLAKKWVFGYRPEDLLIMSHLNVSIVDCLKNYEKLLIDFMGTSKTWFQTVLEKIVYEVSANDYQDYITRAKENYESCDQFTNTHPSLNCCNGIPMTVMPYIYDGAKVAEQQCFEISDNHLGLFTVKYDEPKDLEFKIVVENKNKETEDSSTKKNFALVIESDEFRKKKSMDVANLSQYLQEGEFTISFGDLDNYPFCTCSFWHLYKLPCVHMCAIFSKIPEWKYDMLSPLYRCSNVFNIDYSCLDGMNNSKSIDKGCQTFPISEKVNVHATLGIPDGTQICASDGKIFKCVSELKVTEMLLQQCNDYLLHLNKMAFLFQDRLLHKNIRLQLQVLAGKIKLKLSKHSSLESIQVNIDKHIPTRIHSVIDKQTVASSKPLSINKPNMENIKKAKFIQVHNQDELNGVLKSLSKSNPNTQVKLVHRTSAIKEFLNRYKSKTEINALALVQPAQPSSDTPKSTENRTINDTPKSTKYQPSNDAPPPKSVLSSLIKAKPLNMPSTSTYTLPDHKAIGVQQEEVNINTASTSTEDLISVSPPTDRPPDNQQTPTLIKGKFKNNPTAVAFSHLLPNLSQRLKTLETKKKLIKKNAKTSGVKKVVIQKTFITRSKSNDVPVQCTWKDVTRSKTTKENDSETSPRHKDDDEAPTSDLICYEASGASALKSDE